MKDCGPSCPGSVVDRRLPRLWTGGTRTEASANNISGGASRAVNRDGFDRQFIGRQWALVCGGRAAMRTVLGLCSTLALALAAPSPVHAHWPGQPQHQIAHLGEFQFEGGGVIKNLKMSYVTHGTLNAAKDNAILFQHGFAMNHHQADHLIGPGRPLCWTRCLPWRRPRVRRAGIRPRPAGHARGVPGIPVRSSTPAPMRCPATRRSSHNGLDPRHRR